MKALVTGATGFVGSHLVRELLGQNCELRVLARPNSPWSNLEGLDVERVEGDLQDAASLRRAAQGCRSVFHAAAQYTFWDADPQSYYRVNLEGTRNILAACQQAGVEKLIYTSTIATVGGGRSPGALLDERAAYNLDETRDHYIISKHQAEGEVQKAAAEGRVNAVIVNPGGPIGARDLKPTPTGFMLMKFLNGEVPVYLSGGFNLVGASDVARGHWLVHEKGKTGERYILSGENRTIKDWLGRFASVTGMPPVRIWLPNFLALVGAHVLEAVANYVTRKPPLLTTANIRASKFYFYYDSSKAKRELGWQTTPIDDHIREAALWFLEKGYVKPRKARRLRESLG